MYIMCNLYYLHIIYMIVQYIEPFFMYNSYCKYVDNYVDHD